MKTNDPFVQFKAGQKQGWGLFAPLEAVTIPAAAMLVDFAEIAPGQRVLDCACGTGVVAITAARRKAQVKGLDLSPALLERARSSAAMAQVEVEFKEGDVEELPYDDASFDVVLSQFGHMFAPRPEIAVSEMLRVLKPGGRIAFSTWPPDHFIARMFAITASFVPLPPGAASPPAWGEPSFVREHLGAKVKGLEFDRNFLSVPMLSPQHARDLFEKSSAPLVKVVNDLKDDHARLSQFRAEMESLIRLHSRDNVLRQHYLLSRATKI